MRIRIAIETRAPLCISRGRTVGNELATAWRIAGGTWRGALADYLIRDWELGRFADQDGRFARLFLKGEVRFGDLRLEGGQPWPLSARGCSREDHHPVVDLLAASAAGRDLPLTCPEEGCGAKVALPRNEYYSRDDYQQPVPAAPKRRITAHTAIEGRSLRVREEQFFSTEVLERDQRFVGDIWCSDEAGAVLQSVASEGLRISVGRGVTRGQGDSWLTLSAAGDEDPAAALRQRLEQFNARFTDLGYVVFSCTLLSPALILDEFLFASSWVTAADIAEAAGEPGALDGYEVKAAYSRMQRLSGWDARADLPKSDEWTVAPGSTFWYRSKETVADLVAEIDRLARILAKAEQGIGQRWEEGLGEARFCDSFHFKQVVL